MRYRGAHDPGGNRNTELNRHTGVIFNIGWYSRLVTSQYSSCYFSP